MWRLIAASIVIIILLAGIDYAITSSGSRVETITVTSKYIDGNVYFVETMSLDKFETTGDIYHKLDGGFTYKIKISDNKIVEVIKRGN